MPRLLDEAREVAFDFDVPTVWSLRTPITALVANFRPQLEGLKHLLREETLACALRSGGIERFAALLAGFAQWYATRGEGEMCADLLHSTVNALPCVGAEPMLPILVAAHGHPADVPRARALLVRWATPTGNPIGPAYLGLFDAQAARRGGGRNAAAAEQAARGFHAFGLPYYEAQARELTDRPAEALALYRRLEAHGDRQRLEAVLAPPTGRHGRRTTELTPREREIAKLVAAGKPNRAIAETLVISERTVESHVAAILAKLQIGSRAELHLVLPDAMPSPGRSSLGG